MISPLGDVFGSNTKRKVNNMKIGVYGASFDPVTFGHTNIIQRASKMFDKLYVVVANNPDKKTMFTVEERIELLEVFEKELYNVKIKSWDGLLVNFALKMNANVLVRGLRAVSDFEMELQMAQINRTQCNEIDTIHLATDAECSFLSSSAVKAVAKFNGDISGMVPPHVEEAVKQKMHEPF